MLPCAYLILEHSLTMTQLKFTFKSMLCSPNTLILYVTDKIIPNQGSKKIAFFTFSVKD